jgi:hypothetical protein
MERYVNKGSPSGFTTKNTVSKAYDPYVGNSTFRLPYYGFHIDDIGVFCPADSSPARHLFIHNEHCMFPIHPDMVEKFSKGFGLDEFNPENIIDYFTVTPLANARTVSYHSKSGPIHIKLHYESILGRVFRSLPHTKAVAGPEISFELMQCMNRKSSPKSFAILPEEMAIVKRTSSDLLPEVGAVLRNGNTYPHIDGRFLLPFFALFSRDQKSPEDPLLLSQILRLSPNPEETLLDEIIGRILECYEFLTFDRGLVPEINAQNILLEIDRDGTPRRIVFRDFQGFEKDLTIRRQSGLPLDFHSYPYKCIDRDVDETHYFIRHSFSYDFKLGCYIFDELLEIAKGDLNRPMRDLCHEVVRSFERIMGKKARNHFKPKAKWYAHDKILLTKDRPYIELDGPRYRR